VRPRLPEVPPAVPTRSPGGPLVRVVAWRLAPARPPARGPAPPRGDPRPEALAAGRPRTRSAASRPSESAGVPAGAGGGRTLPLARVAPRRPPDAGTQRRRVTSGRRRSHQRPRPGRPAAPLVRVAVPRGAGPGHPGPPPAALGASESASAPRRRAGAPPTLGRGARSESDPAPGGEDAPPGPASRGSVPPPCPETCGVRVRAGGAPRGVRVSRQRVQCGATRTQVLAGAYKGGYVRRADPALRADRVQSYTHACIQWARATLGPRVAG
jgi:hypothetical protein